MRTITIVQGFINICILSVDYLLSRALFQKIDTELHNRNDMNCTHKTETKPHGPLFH